MFTNHNQSLTVRLAVSYLGLTSIIIIFIGVKSSLLHPSTTLPQVEVEAEHFHHVM